jgi:hypothetical protein
MMVLSGTPSVRFTNSPTTGIYRQAADAIGISTTGVERIRVTSGGNVGIGLTADPAEKLEVGGNIRLRRDAPRNISVSTEPDNATDGKLLTIASGNAFNNSGGGNIRYGGNLVLQAGTGHLINNTSGPDAAGGDIIIRSGSNHLTVTGGDDADGGDIIFEAGRATGNYAEVGRISQSGALRLNQLGGSGTRLLRTDNSGNVSISTIDPANVGTVTSVALTMPTGFSVASSPITTNGTIAVTSTLTNGLPVYATATGLTTTAPSTGVQGYWTRTGTFLYNSNLGDNVGIGVSAPGNRLEVAYQGAGDRATMSITGPGNAQWGQLFMLRTTGAGSDGASMVFRSKDAKNWSIGGESTAGTPGFQIREDGGDAQFGAGFGTPRIHIAPGGNVGVGNTNPLHKLSVLGDGRFGAAGPNFVFIGTGTSGTGNGGMEIFTSGNVGYIRYHDPNVAWRDLALNDAGGNVGIGTIGPAYKLDVNGSTRVAGGLYTAGTASTLYGATASIYANNANAYGGGIMISDDGGFFDYNDGPVTFNGSTGLRIAGNNGPASSNGYLRVNGLAGTGNRPIYADANGTLTTSSGGNGGAISYVKNEYYGVSSTRNTWVSVTGASPWMNVRSGDQIKLDGMYYGRLTGGDNNEFFYGRILIEGQAGCGTNYSNQHDYWHTSENGADHDNFKPVVYMDVWNCNCNGQIRFVYQLYMGGDDNWEAREIIITGTRF